MLKGNLKSRKIRVKVLQMAFAALFLLGVDSSRAQQTVFSVDPPGFMKELGDLFKATPERQATKEFLDDLKLYMESPDVPDEVKQRNIGDCNLLAQRRARPFPDYHTYFQTYFVFARKGFWDGNYVNWNTAFKVMLEDRKVPLRHVVAFLNQTSGLVGENVLSSTASFKWVSRNPSFKLIYQDGVLRVDVGTTDLLCYAQGDSITIAGTSGSYYPAEQMWHGQGGKVYWEKSKFNPQEVNATLFDYRIDMTKSQFTIDSVKFYNTNYFSYPLYGSLENKVMGVSTPEKAIYPKFISSNQEFKIDHIFPRINYVGGFSQIGSKFQGTGTPEKPAQVNIFRNDTLFVEARSISFGLYENLIISSDAEVIFHLDTLAIYHPGLVFRYMAANNELHLIRGKEGLGQSPYFNTFHNVSMDVELIRWQLDQPFMELRMVTGAAQNHALFESLSYYREAFFNQLQGMDAIHPLQGLKNCSKFYKGEPFTALEYANFMRLPESPIRQQVINLSFHGFLDYNVNTDVITLKPRLFDYLLFRLGKKDFDVIRFNSITPGEMPNAVLDLQNYDMNLKGVSAIAIADHQNVVFFPKEGDILLKRNRNFRFDGVINAGMMNLFGNGFLFAYDKFRIELSNIDSLKLRIRTGELDYFGQGTQHEVNNTIAQLSGYLQIDKPDNKSGNQSFPAYPILSSDKPSYVYFDKKEIQGGAYNRDNFYFTVDPFEMDSLSNLNRANTVFAGLFQSGIFPDFRQKLVVRPDFSLGFVQQSPPGGYPIYDGKARFTNNIDLSNSGLKGNGVLNYQTATARSEEFVFLPQETKGVASEFTVDKRTSGVLYPDVKSQFSQINFFPLQEELVAKSMEENFTMFGTEAQLEGSLRVAPTGLSGRGNLYMLRATLNSRYMDFGDHTVLADSSNFKLVTKETQDISFSTSNLVSNIDFEKRMGTFRSLAGGSRVDFTDNRYISFINEFSWNMDNNDIFLGTRGSKGNKFVSIHKQQDSLYFYAPLARFDAENKLIEAEEVKDILTADAKVFLKDGRITIREDAVMDPLDSVTIVLKDTLVTHTIYDARITIEGAKKYSGLGSYDYVNALGDKYKLFMAKISADEKNRTSAQGSIGEEAKFQFDSHFAYKGDFTMKAGQKFFDFDGGTRMIHDDPYGPRTFVRFQSAIDPAQVRIPIGEKIENYERERIHKDFFIRKDSVHVYSSFLESRKDYSDIPIISGQGFLVHNDRDNTFDMVAEQKLAKPDTTGTLLRFIPSTGQIMGEGVLDLGVELDPIKVRSSGTIFHKRQDNEIKLMTMMELDFFFDTGLASMIYKTIMTSKAPASDVPVANFTRRLNELMPREAVDALLKAGATAVVDQKLPDDGNLFTFSNLDMSWNHARKCYVVDGVADLAMMRSRNVNKKVKVKAEILRSRVGNSIDWYLEVDDQWFYFAYKNGTMHALSSVKEFNTLLQQLKPEDRKFKGGLGGKSSIYILSPDSKRKRFLQKFNGEASPADEPGDEEASEKEE
ncbi:MAG: hypothetical protein ACWA6U_09805 [Breznakibacter sp.]